MFILRVVCVYALLKQKTRANPTLTFDNREVAFTKMAAFMLSKEHR